MSRRHDVSPLPSSPCTPQNATYVPVRIDPKAVGAQNLVLESDYRVPPMCLVFTKENGTTSTGMRTSKYDSAQKRRRLDRKNAVVSVTSNFFQSTDTNKKFADDTASRLRCVGVSQDAAFDVRAIKSDPDGNRISVITSGYATVLCNANDLRDATIGDALEWVPEDCGIVFEGNTSKFSPCRILPVKSGVRPSMSRGVSFAALQNTPSSASASIFDTFQSLDIGDSTYMELIVYRVMNAMALDGVDFERHFKDSILTEQIINPDCVVTEGLAIKILNLIGTSGATKEEIYESKFHLPYPKNRAWLTSDITDEFPIAVDDREALVSKLKTKNVLIDSKNEYETVSRFIETRVIDKNMAAILKVTADESVLSLISFKLALAQLYTTMGIDIEQTRVDKFNVKGTPRNCMDLLYYLALVNTVNETASVGGAFLDDLCDELAKKKKMDGAMTSESIETMIDYERTFSGSSITSSEPIQAADTSRVFGILQQKNPFENSCEVLLMPGLRYSM